MVIKSEHLPAPGETILGGEFLMNPGGKGANQAVAAAKLGGEVVLVAKVGDDIGQPRGSHAQIFITKARRLVHINTGDILGSQLKDCSIEVSCASKVLVMQQKGTLSADS